MSLTFLAKSCAYSWKMSLAGQVLCQRMLVGPCALTMVGAATVAAAPTAAVFRKRRRLDVVSFFRCRHGFLPVLSRSPWRSHHIYWQQDKGLRRVLARKFRTLRRFDAPPPRG